LPIDARVCLALAMLAALAPFLLGQVNTGNLRGSVVDANGHPAGGVSVVVEGSPAFAAEATTRPDGEFEMALPYGAYRVVVRGQAPIDIAVPPRRTACLRITLGGGSGPCPEPPAFADLSWAAPYQAPDGARTTSLSSLLLLMDPVAVAEPIDFSGPVSTPLGLLSERAFSWTDTAYAAQGVDVTDPYQPGRPDAPLDASGAGEVAVRTGFDLGTSRAYGSELDAFVPAPSPAWHAAAASSGTGSFLASDNLPAAAQRGLLQQAARYSYFSNDRVQGGGAIGRRIDWLGSFAGQWSSQTVPLALTGSAMASRLLLSSAIVRVQLTPKDQIQFDLADSRVRLSDWGTPAGIEAWAGRRMAPPLTIASIEGFAGCPEDDRFDSFQAAWSRQTAGGMWQARAAASWAELDTSNALPGGQSVIDMVGGETNGVAPLTNLGGRTRQAASAAYAPRRFEIGATRHVLTLGAEWDHSGIRNQFNAPSGMNLITAGGAPAFVVVFDTPLDSRQRVSDFSAFARDAIALEPWLTLDLGVVADFARGGPIAWNSLSPRAGLALAPVRRLVLRGSYARLFAPLAGRYLDFAGNSLGGLEYQWIDRNHDGRFDPGDLGPLLMAFGGPYSSIDPGLRRPYADEFNVGVEASLPGKSLARGWFFRRDEKSRIAGVDTGVPAADFTPVQILDPGPDGVPGDFDDQSLTVYSQQPASLGQDRYLLTNPPGLRTLAEGMVAETGSQWRGYGFHASFMAVKAYGPSNPGNSPWENDPGVIGALYSDPNAAINAAGRQFFDRAYVGKAQFWGRLPRFLGGIRWENTVNYMDGAAFARLLLVTGLPQGPFWVDATVRGSPGGGNRAEHVMNWNLRLSRGFHVARGDAQLAFDMVNVLNSDNRIREIETSGPAFNQRLPIAIEPARFVRIGIQYGF
jgi:hypothetical protein